MYINESFCETVGEKDVPEEFTGEYRKALPSGEKRITIYFPNLYRMQIKDFSLENFNVLRAHNGKCTLISYGDSITQGYDSFYPSLTYVNLLAKRIDAVAFNKGIGADCFRPELLAKTGPVIPDIVTVAYGTNDWSHLSREVFYDNMSLFLERLCKSYPSSEIFVITPIWRSDCQREVLFGSFESMVKMIRDEAMKYKNIKVITGESLLPHTTDLFSDGYLHPNDLGMSIYAEGLYRKIIGE